MSAVLPIPEWITLPRPPTATEQVFWYPFTAEPALHQGAVPGNSISGSGTNVTIEQHSTFVGDDYPRADWPAIGTPPLPTGQITDVYGVVQGSFTNVNGFASLLSPTLGTSFGIVGDPLDWAGIIYTEFTGGLRFDPTAFPWQTFDLQMRNYSSVTWEWDGVHPSLFSITDVGFLIYAEVGSIVVRKVTQPAGSPQGFDFMLSQGDPFTLHDGEQNTSVLAPGTQTISETPVEGWDTALLAHDQDDHIVTIRQPEGAFDLAAGQTITITFTNSTQKVIVTKQTSPPGNLQDFTFHPSWGADFTLQDGASHDSGKIPAGTYTLIEDAVTGWLAAEIVAVDQDDNPVEIGPDGSFALGVGQIVTITFTNTRCLCLDFTEAVIRDANDIEQVVAGGADGKLYLLYDGISDNGKYFTGEALALKYVGPQRTAVHELEWYGSEFAKWFIAKELTTPFDSSQMDAFGAPEEVQDDENSNHWRARLPDRMQMIHAYLLMQLTGYEGGTMELNDPPHMPVETYGRVLLVSPQAGGANPR